MKKLRFGVTIILLLVVVTSCRDRIDAEDSRQGLLELNDRHRAAHLAGDVQTILDGMAPEYFQVRRGRVYELSAQDNKRRFESYLGSMKILAWDDIAKPVVFVSDDGTLATMLVTKRLAMIPVNAPDTSEPMEGVYAWQATYRRVDDNWIMIADATTELPPEERATEDESL